MSFASSYTDRPLTGREVAILELEWRRREAEKARLAAEGARVVFVPTPVFVPNPGSQALVVDLILNTRVDEIYYMGQAGGGKSHLTLGVAGSLFQNALIFRRKYSDLTGAEGLIEKSRGIFSEAGGYNAAEKVWRLDVGGLRRFVQFSGCEHESDRFDHQGRPHDLYAFDEITQFPPSVPSYVTGWRRSPDPTQRTLVLYTGNPPVDSQGEWVTERIRAWVDPAHPRHAKPGEIRWFVAKRDLTEIEVSGPQPVKVDGEMREPISRTFVPSVLAENPTYANGEYALVLDKMPEPLRSILKRGDFLAARSDDAWQVIPSEWVRAAMLRDMPNLSTIVQTSTGADVAHGGADQTVIARRFGHVVAPLEVYAGADTPTGGAAAAKIALAMGPGFVNVDAIGYGASACDTLLEMDDIGARVRAVNVGASTPQRTRGADGKPGPFGFANQRALAYWRLREALDPELGEGVILPDDMELFADLTSVRYSVRSGRIALEDKSGIKSRIGRSPDKGDAVSLAFLSDESNDVDTWLAIARQSKERREAAKTAA